MMVVIRLQKLSDFVLLMKMGLDLQINGPMGLGEFIQMITKPSQESPPFQGID
jgi:hypothetical protein